VVWPEKPQLLQFLYDIEIPSRPMADLAMTPGLVGEAYVNLGFLGVVLTCGLVSAGYTLAYFRAAPPELRAPGLGKSPSLLLYLIFLSCAMQVYRDALISLFGSLLFTPHPSE